MFEQERYLENQRSAFRGPDRREAGMSSYQVSGPGESAEISAEAAADQAVGGIFRASESTGGAPFQAELADTDLAGGGSPLPTGLMGSMEQSLGASFSGVRLHTDAGADRASRQIAARAFTRGQDIYFRGGEYAPETPEGQHLIAHELAHVAAGDTGIHRVRDGHTTSTAELRKSAGSSGVDKGTILEMAMESSAEPIQKDLDRANTFIGACGTKEILAAEIQAGRVGKEKVEGRTKTAEQIKKILAEGINDLEKLTGDYVTEVSGGSAEKNKHYKKAQAILEGLKTAKAQIETTVESALRWAAEAFKARDDGTGSELPQTVGRMLDDPACGQFFQAVSEVQQASGGADISASEEAAYSGENAKHLREDVGTGGADRAGRFFSAAGAGLGITGAAVSAVDLGAGFDEEIKGEDNVSGSSERAGTAASHMSAIVDTLGAANDTASSFLESKQLHHQEQARAAKIKAMQGRGTAAKDLSAVDHTARTAAAGSWMGASSSILGAANSIYGTTTGKGDEDKSRLEERQGNILSVSSDSVAVGGDVLGLAASGRQADQLKKQDTATKQSMTAIGRQLRKTLDAPPALPDERKALLTRICERMEGRQFNKATPPLKDMIAQALQPPAAGSPQQSGGQQTGGGQGGGSGELSSKQKTLLTTLMAMETSRASTKDAVSGARWDTGFNALGTVGDMTSLASSISFMAGAGMPGLILSTISSVIGLIGSLRDAHNARQDNGAEAQQGRNEERDAKVNACRAAVKQMAVLPALDLGTLRAARQAGLPLLGSQADAAEQYAAVFSIVKAANVNMVDFLYAIHMGGFGQQEAGGQTRSLDASLNAMYKNLIFE